jgi:hypothetical protein
MASLSTKKVTSECSKVVRGGQDGVVGLNDGGGDLGRGVDGELELALLAVVEGEALHEEGAETGSGSTTEGVEDQETLKARAVVSQFADTVHDGVNELLANGVVTTGIVVGGILLAGDELLGVEELAVSSSADLIDHTRLQVNKDGTGNVLSRASLSEEGAEGIITERGVLVGEGSVGLNSVFQAVELPAGVTDLDTSLTNMN